MRVYFPGLINCNAIKKRYGSMASPMIQVGHVGGTGAGFYHNGFAHIGWEVGCIYMTFLFKI